MPNARHLSVLGALVASAFALGHDRLDQRTPPALPPSEAAPIGHPDEPSERIAARLDPSDVYAKNSLFLNLVVRWEHLPPFDPALAPGETTVSSTRLTWGRREPGLLVAGRRSDWPEVVEEKLVARAQERFHRVPDSCAANSDLEVGAPWPKQYAAFRTVLPGSLTVYALEHPAVITGASGLSVVVHDPHTGRVSPQAITLTRRWSRTSTYDGPSASMADIAGDGAPEIGFLCTFHNGTDINGTGRMWFSIGPDLELTFVRQSSIEQPYTVDSHGGAGIIRARMVRGADGTVREEGWFENPTFAFTPRRVPQDVLESIGKKAIADEPLMEPMPRVR